MTSNFLISLILVFPNIYSLHAHKAHEDTRKQIVIPPDQKVILLLGGVADMEVKGRTVNTISLAELIFPNGEHCYPDNFVLPFGLGAGFAMSDRKDRVVSCFGFNNTLPFNGCIIWKKVNGTWLLPRTASIKGTDSTMSYIQSLHQEDPENLLFPTWTPCNQHGCVYFYFNTDSYGSALMRAELKEDDTVSISTIQRARNKVRSCLVLVDNHLIQLGGVNSQFDYLNMGQQVQNVKILHLDKAGTGSMGSWKDSACGTSYIGYMQTCIKLKGDGKATKILSIGGEIQMKKMGSVRNDDDDIFDLADVRVLTFSAKPKPLVTNEEGKLDCAGKEVKIPNGIISGSLKTGRKDMAWGFMEKNNVKYLAMGIGGRTGFGVHTVAQAGVVIAELDNTVDMIKRVKKADEDNTTLYTRLTIPRYAINQASIMSDMFVGDTCTVRDKREDEADGKAGKMCLNLGFIIFVTLIGIIVR